MIKKKKCVFISLSLGETKVYNYYKKLGDCFIKRGFYIVYIYDKKIQLLPNNTKDEFHFTWPNNRPTKLKDFLFLNRLIKKHKPIYCISIFGSVNVMTIVSFINKVKNRIAWIRTTNQQIKLDSKKIFISKLLNFRKKIVYKLLTNIYTNSKGTKHDAIKTFNLKESKISVLHNLTNKSNINYVSQDERDFSLIIVGRLEISKGHESLFHQFKLLVDIYPLIKLKVIGTGPLKNKLLNLAKELNLDNNILFYGNVSNNMVANYFSKSLIGISSSYSEAFGWVNIESLREGTPIISTRTEGAKDIIIENENGLFFSHEDIYSLKNQVDKILKKWEIYSVKSLEVFNTKFSFENQIENHFKKITKI